MNKSRREPGNEATSNPYKLRALGVQAAALVAGVAALVGVGMVATESGPFKPENKSAIETIEASDGTEVIRITPPKGRTSLDTLVTDIAANPSHYPRVMDDIKKDGLASVRALIPPAHDRVPPEYGERSQNAEFLLAEIEGDSLHNRGLANIYGFNRASRFTPVDSPLIKELESSLSPEMRRGFGSIMQSSGRINYANHTNFVNPNPDNQGDPGVSVHELPDGKLLVGLSPSVPLEPPVGPNALGQGS